jgi:hypothetical protein
MFEALTFIVVLALIRLCGRAKRSVPQPVRVDIYHHFIGGGPGERLPEGPLLLTNLAPPGDNVVPMRRTVRK